MSRRPFRNRTPVLRPAALGLLGAASFGAAGLAQAPQVPPPSWPFAGGNISNTHAQISPPSNVGSPTQINPATASKLKVKWSLVTAGDISATPTVEAGGLYVPDWAGMLYKVNPDNGAVVWKHAVCDYTASCYSPTQSISRTAPAIGTNNIVIGDAVAHYQNAPNGAVVIGVNKATGARAWATYINNTSRYASVLGSPVIYNNIAYVGTASWEEGIQGSDASYKPTFRGNVVALNVDTGAIIWQFTTVPAGYSGGPIPGSNMAVFPRDNALLVATGNNYSIPADRAACVAAAGNNTSAQTACLDPSNYVDALLSLRLDTGAIKWGRKMNGADTWTEACYSGSPACPKPTGSDSDFAQAPIVTWLPNFQGRPDDLGGTSQSYIMAAGQKNSVFYGVNPFNGGLFWKKFIGIGGMEWGSAFNTDDYNHFYFALNNPQRVPQTIIGKGGNTPQPWDAGAWGALDASTGALKWTVPTIGKDLVQPSRNAAAPGCVTFTNRVLFAGSTSGVMVAFDANSGFPFWTFPSGGTVVSCPAIYNETVYWGTGYARYGVGKHMLYAFSVQP